MPRKNWGELPEEVHTAIREQTGPIRRVEPVASGFSSQFVATLDTAGGRVFVKGMLRDHPLAWTQRREAAVNPYVTPVGPRVLWRTTTDGWDLLGFEYLTGRSADYAPGSADLPLVVEALTALGQLPHPGAGAEAEDAVERFGGHLDDPADAALFAGTALLHTDWFYTNVHITGRGDGARVIDWAWATRGAAWIDPACWVVWLGFAGHDPYGAEQWAAKVPAWSTASARELDLIAVALRGYWQDMADEHPNEWTRRLLDSANRWAAYRLGC
ncbi:aminoglycoside phosphotransferase [Streptomyces sp. NPDC001933]|uniref:aminoglycoside phosphotransferase n=1 Tax=Streptomyces sp. NPDC001933 TaxID=3364626 RepID=UPI00369718B6